MKLGIYINDYDWTGGAARLGPLIGEIVFAAICRATHHSTASPKWLRRRERSALSIHP